MDKFNVIYDDENIVGKVSEIKRYFINELAKKINDEELSTDEKINIINMVQDLLKQLENEKDNTIIKVFYNAMGCFNYKYMVEED